MAQPNKPMTAQALPNLARQSAITPAYLRGLGGLPQHSLQHPTVWAIGASARSRPLPTSAASPTIIGSRPNAEVDPHVPGVTPAKSVSAELTKKHHRRDADVQVSTARSGASLTETIRCFGGPSNAAQRLGRKSDRLEGAVGLLLHTTFNQKSTCTKSIRAQPADLARRWKLPDAGPRPQRSRLHQNRLDPTELYANSPRPKSPKSTQAIAANPELCHWSAAVAPLRPRMVPSGRPPEATALHCRPQESGW